MIPVGAPTALFSASWPTRARVGRSSLRAHVSLSATATALSIAADELRPAPTGTVESMWISTPGTPLVSAQCPSAHATPSG